MFLSRATAKIELPSCWMGKASGRAALEGK